MPYPVIIANTLGFDMADCGAGDFGFEYNGDQYAFLADVAASQGVQPTRLHCFLSSDQGLTWTELDSGNAPVVNAGTSVPCFYTVARDGATALMLWTRMHNSMGNRVIDGFTRCTFDLTNGLWGTPVDISSSGLDFMRPPSNSSKVCFRIVVRGTGDYIVFYSGTLNAGTNGRVSYSTYDGTSLGAEVQLPSQTVGQAYNPIGPVYDSDSGITQFLYRNGQITTTNKPVLTCGLSGANVLGTPQTQAAETESWYMTSQPIVFDNAGTPTFAFATVTDDDSVVTQSVRVYYGPVTLDLALSNSVVTTGVQFTDDFLPWTQAGSFDNDPKNITIASDGTTIQVNWTAWLFNSVDAPSAFLGSVSNVGTFSWGAVSTLWQAEQSLPADDYKAIQIYSFGGTLGIGTIGISDNQGFPPGTLPENTQFSFAAGPPPPPTVTNIISQSAGGNATCNYEPPKEPQILRYAEPAERPHMDAALIQASTRRHYR